MQNGSMKDAAQVKQYFCQTEVADEFCGEFCGEYPDDGGYNNVVSEDLGDGYCDACCNKIVYRVY